MEVIIIRHGDALDAGQAATLGLSDGERPLTDTGRRQTRAAAAGLRHILGDDRVDSILVSPLLRARQTADILRAYLDDPVTDETDALAPAAGADIIDTLLHDCAASERRSERLALIGHEPDLSAWTSWSLTRKTSRLTAFKTNGTALIEFPGVAEGGTGTLRWLLTGAQLRALAPPTAS